MPCVYTYDTVNSTSSGDFTESNCTARWSEQDYDNSQTYSASMSPWSIAWFRYVKSGGNYDNCFVNLSDSTATTVNRCGCNGGSCLGGHGTIGPRVNIGNLQSLTMQGYPSSNTWHNDIEQIWVQSTPKTEDVCMDKVAPEPYIGKAGYNCPAWYSQNKDKVRTKCMGSNLKNPPTSDACRWLRDNEKTTWDNLWYDWCSSGVGTRKNECRGLRNSATGSLKTRYDQLFYDYCKNFSNIGTTFCKDIAKTPDNTKRADFDQQWTRYCSLASNKNKEDCACFSGDPKYAGQAFCFNPTCANTGYRTENMEKIKCADICQSIFDVDAGRDAKVSDVKINIVCGDKPGTGTTQPGTGTTQPGTGTTQPGTGTTQPGTGTTQPGTGTAQPGTSTGTKGKSSKTIIIIVVVIMCFLLLLSLGGGAFFMM